MLFWGQISSKFSIPQKWGKNKLHPSSMYSHFLTTHYKCSVFLKCFLFFNHNFLVLLTMEPSQEPSFPVAKKAFNPKV